MNLAAGKTATYQIRLEPSGREIVCKDGQTLLDAAIRSGLQIPYGCRHGNCSACKAQVLEGEYQLLGQVSEFALLGFERDEGYVLLCSTIPESDMVVEVEEEIDPAIRFFPVRDFRAKVVRTVDLTHDIKGVYLRLEEPADIPYAAGQFFEFDIPGLPETRAYSMAGRYVPGNLLEFHVKRIPGGIGSNYMCDLREGSAVTGSGPYGKTQLRDRNKNLLFVAGGSGMAPVKALIEELFEQPYRHEAWFFYGARSERDLFFMREWTEFAAKHPNFHFVPALSDKAPEDRWTGEEGYIADVVSRHFEQMDNMDAYLCGPPAMIQSTLKVLYKGGLRSSNIFYDEF